MSSEVYFSDIENRQRDECLRVLLNGTDKYISQFKENSFVGIKVTIGDEHSTGYLKPELVRIIVDKLKGQGARPFVFDTNVIYSGKRQNSIDHMELADRKGFTTDKLGCPYFVVDSVFGTDSQAIEVDFKNLKEIKVPSIVKVLDDLIVLSHVTGHIMSGFAGSMKNVAMGMASRAGKQIQHSSLKPTVNVENCTMCGACIEICPREAISETGSSAYINSNLCVGCAECIPACKLDAINVNWKEDGEVFAERMTEYAGGILSMIKRKVFINFAIDITRECDCIAGDDTPMARDAGIFLSDDVLALDKVCYDRIKPGRDIFARGGKISAHLRQFKYAQEIGLGCLDYKLIKL